MEDSNDLESRLAQLRAQRAEQELRRENRRAAAKLQDEIEAETRAIKENELLEALEAEHGPLGKKLKRVPTPEGMIVVKRPNHVLFKRFQDQGKFRYQDLEGLVRPHVVYPDKVEFQRLVEEYPATMAACANAVCSLAGVGQQDAAGE